jgi:RNA polymerase sigma-70 factor (ECF subfamily)
VTTKVPTLRLVKTARPQAGGPEPLDDVRLVAAIRAGIAGMAGTLHDRMRPLVAKTVKRLLGAADSDVEDLIQVAMIELLRSLSRYRGECSLGTWSTTIAANVVCKHLRRRGLERALFAREALSEDLSNAHHRQPMLRGLVERVAHHLRKMPYDRSWTFLLHDVHGYSLEEVARITGVSIAAAQSRLVRGRRELHERIEADPGLAGGLESLEASS